MSITPAQFSVWVKFVLVLAPVYFIWKTTRTNRRVNDKAQAADDKFLILAAGGWVLVFFVVLVALGFSDIEYRIKIIVGSVVMVTLTYLMVWVSKRRPAKHPHGDEPTEDSEDKL